ncbi:MAG: hydrolase glyoxylase [Kangiella sp.]|nr:MAG: hydrolase glyoxylase [Kangiella sp.]
MIFKQFFDQTSSTFTYLMATSRGAEALIIDPVLDRVHEYLQFLGENELRLVVAMDTHVHADHKTGLGKLRKLTRCMTCMSNNASVSTISRRLKDGDSISVGEIEIKVFDTPGHTDDSLCYYIEDMIFTGDTLFIRGNGRSDFQNGDAGQLYDSITQKLFTLPDETVVWPGHDYKGEHVSTIKKEKIQNPRVAGKSRNEFIEIMDSLDLPNPQLMDIAVPFNQGFADNLGTLMGESVVLNCEQVESLEEPLLIDLRDQDEADHSGMLKGAILIPLRDLDGALEDPKHIINQGKEVVFYCAHGERSALGLEFALENGLKNAKHMSGGIHAWIDAGRDVA